MLKFFFGFTLIMAVALGAAHARVLYVALDGTGDYTSHQAAFAACLNGDTILIAPGDYGTAGATLSAHSDVVVAGSGFSATPYVSTKIGAITLANCTNCEVWSLWIRGVASISGTGNSLRRCLHDGTTWVGAIVTVDGAAQNTQLIDDLFYTIWDASLANLGGTGTLSGCVFTRLYPTPGNTGAVNASGGMWAITNSAFLNLNYVVTGTGQLDLRNNVVWNVNNFGAQTPFQTSSYNASNLTLPGDHNVLLTQTPFVNYTSGGFVFGTSDLHLNASTPCWDAGDPFIHDRYGRGHSASLSDMGCYGGMMPFVDEGQLPFPAAISLSVTPVVQVGDSILIQTTGRTTPRY